VGFGGEAALGDADAMYNPRTCMKAAKGSKGFCKGAQRGSKKRRPGATKMPRKNSSRLIWSI